MHDPDLDEYLTEYRLQTPVEPISHYEDGELEARWLAVSGFSKLAKAFDEGREVQWKELNAALAGLAESHAEAVKQRVNALNRTVRGRNRTRHARKPDIRDVFPDVDISSTGTRSRSATPDSLDYQQNHHHVEDGRLLTTTGSIGTGLGGTLNLRKQNLQRTSSTPLRGSAELFRGSHIRCDIPFYTEGIELVAFHRLGTIHIPRIRASSDPNCSVRHRGDCQLNSRHGGACCQYGGGVDSNNNNNNNNQNNKNGVGGLGLCSSGSGSNSGSDISSPGSSSPPNSPPRGGSNLMVTSANSSPAQRSSPEPISFENLCTRQSNSILLHESISEAGCDIDDLSEGDYKKVQSLLWLELAALFDKHRVAFDKRKPMKRKKKEEGNLFGVSLNALVRRDQLVTGEDTSLVPLILQAILKELTDRGITEKGILRVAGHKQKIESLYTELETNFYAKPEKVKPLLKRSGVHDLSAMLKRWLRELPQPLLSNELVHLFYQTHAIPQPDQYKALSVLCLLLPHENRNTFRALISFLNKVIDLQAVNKMSKHNVATIIAPSIFPPRFIHPKDMNDIGAQVQMAAKCCHLAEALITQEQNLWMVPQRLIDEARKVNKPKNRNLRKTKSIVSSTTTISGPAMNIVNPNHIHRLVLQTGN